MSCKNPQEGVLYFISGLYKISVIFSLHWVFYNWHDPSGGNGQRSFMSWLRFHRTTAIFPFRLKPWLISHFYIWNNTVWNVIDINWNVSHHRCLHLSGILFLWKKKNHGKVWSFAKVINHHINVVIVMWSKWKSGWGKCGQSRCEKPLLNNRLKIKQFSLQAAAVIIRWTDKGGW